MLITRLLTRFKNKMETLIVIGSSILSGILYRMGGSDRFNTKWRDLGVSFCVTALLLLFRRRFDILWCLMVLTSFLAIFGALTTYFKKKDSDANWRTWMITGFMYGASAAPLFFSGVHWYAIIARVIILTMLIPLWATRMNRKIGIFPEDQVNEFGRGFLITVTVPVLLI